MIQDFSSKSHCDNILETIDFFSQVLHPEQLEEYGYQYVHHLLGLENSAIYMKNEASKGFELRGCLGVNGILPYFEKTSQISQLATKVGVTLHGDLSRYLSEEILKSYPANFLMPLIVAEELIGIILGRGWKGESEEDFTFAEAVKKMINNAFYTGIQMIETRKFKIEMDRKFYDQMLLHQIVKIMLSQQDMDQLIKMCVDGIRELTASAKTAFFLLDERSGKLKLKHYEDLLHFQKHYEALTVEAGASAHKILYHVASDAHFLKKIFGEDVLKRVAKFEAEYLVLLKNEPVVGFITLGPTVGDQIYSESVLEMVESIMGTVCMAMENVNAHAALKQSNDQLKETLSAMNDMSRTLSVISSASSLTELCELTMQNLNIHSGFGECHLAIKQGEGFSVITSQCDERIGEYFTLSEHAVKALESGFVMDFDCMSLPRFVLREWLGQTLIFPIKLSEDDLNDSVEGLVICGFFEKNMGQYEVQYAQMLIKGIAALFIQLGKKRESAEIKSPEAVFLEALEKFENDRQTYWIDYVVYYRYAPIRLDLENYRRRRETQLFRLGTYEFEIFYREQAVNEAAFDGLFEGTREEILEAIEKMLNQRTMTNEAVS